MTVNISVDNGPSEPILEFAPRFATLITTAPSKGRRLDHDGALQLPGLAVDTDFDSRGDGIELSLDAQSFIAP